MTNSNIKVGIIGGAGYTGGEMLRLLIHHPHVEMVFVHSQSNGGNPVHAVHQDLLGDTDLKFSSSFDGDIDVLFLCLGHGDSRKFLAENTFDKNVKIIDLSQDFRLKKSSSIGERAFVYGLPELNKSEIVKAQHIANPGCFATCIQLGLLPLAAAGKLTTQVHINATTGSTGAGQSLSATSHFSWRNGNLSVYKAFEHQHLNEISESIAQLQSTYFTEQAGALHFIPQRGAFTRGIMAAMYTPCAWDLDEAYLAYETFYRDAPFVHLSKKNIDLKQVVNTNKALIHLEKHGDQLFVVSMIDNLLKGASGQAVQNMNLMFGLAENAGLRLKSVGF